jgi:hypothetical protein
VYLGYVIGEGKIEINLAKMEAILKWPTPKNVTKVRSFVGVAQYLHKFIASFFSCGFTTPCHNNHQYEFSMGKE